MAVQPAQAAIRLAAAGSVAHQHGKLPRGFVARAARIVFGGVFNAVKQHPHRRKLVHHLRQALAVKLAAVAVNAAHHLAKAVCKALFDGLLNKRYHGQTPFLWC